MNDSVGLSVMFPVIVVMIVIGDSGHDSGRGFLPRLGFRLCSTRSMVRLRRLRFCFGKMCLRWFEFRMICSHLMVADCLPVPEPPRRYRLAAASILGPRSIVRLVI